jgi:hypothetical protein
VIGRSDHVSRGLYDTLTGPVASAGAVTLKRFMVAVESSRRMTLSGFDIERLRHAASVVERIAA